MINVGIIGCGFVGGAGSIGSNIHIKKLRLEEPTAKVLNPLNS